MSGPVYDSYHWTLHERGHVIVQCPECGREGTLNPQNHSVRDSGEVLPSFICPHCGWHGWVRLVGWVSQ